jgi:hypothetical protein
MIERCKKRVKTDYENLANVYLSGSISPRFSEHVVLCSPVPLVAGGGGGGEGFSIVNNLCAAKILHVI